MLEFRPFASVIPPEVVAMLRAEMSPKPSTLKPIPMLRLLPVKSALADIPIVQTPFVFDTVIGPLPITNDGNGTTELTRIFAGSWPDVVVIS